MILMCNNRGIADSSIDQQNGRGYVMEPHSGSAAVAPLTNDDASPRVKFLCSFSGSILPRPQDGKLRYVGGETRIVAVQRDIGYDELMAKMRELYDGAAVLKYQQPDEDLDALVTVVNDEDVVNMMEEYDKVGSAADGFTRLRIFLFSQPENDFSSHFEGGDERETERRYVDALNNLNDGPDFRRQMGTDSSPLMSPGDEPFHYLNSLSLEGGAGLQYNLRRLSIPHVGQHLPMDAPWSPSVAAAFYSPRPVTEFPSSPAAEEYSRPEHLSHYSESNIAWIPQAASAGGGDRPPSAFPGNIFHCHPESSALNNNGNSICEHCRMVFHPSSGPHQAHHLQCPDCPLPLPTHHHHPHHHHHGSSLYSEAPVPGWAVHGSTRVADHYPFDVPSSASSANYAHHRHEAGAEVATFHEETGGARYGNVPFPYPQEAVYPNPNPNPGHMHLTGHPLWRNVQSQAHIAQSGTQRSHWEGGSPWYDFHPGHGSGSRVSSTAAAGTTVVQDHQHPFYPEPVRVSPEPARLASEDREATNPNVSDAQDFSTEEMKSAGSDTNDVGEVLSDGNCDDAVNAKQGGDKEILAPKEADSVVEMIFLPEMVASAKKAALDGANDVKMRVEEEEMVPQEALAGELELANPHVETELDSDTENIDTSIIEPTKAEAEAIDKGLQTIKNDDLEEIRELGSGTYGAVYHGKWRGSDVAIKRIKASCFAGRPSERERLIADFWKEASILSSLHHPNVVSFYGIVRDGPDGSLATVTEFMINGSLKQFLQKKDRTIDRRKRLIIAMDAAFGMEYLHGKNIVHFDLKCENLLVNMRDPQRPICKIGDLGLSKVKQHTLVSGGVRGTLPWMAPELLSGKSNMVTEKIDVYSFGIVMWELLTGEEPYADMHCASIIGGIVNNTLRPQIPTWCDPEWKSLMESCWAAEPASRPSFSEISQKLRNMAAAMNLK